MQRPVVIAVGIIIGSFFATLAATGIALIASKADLEKPYTLSITGISVLLAYVGFHLASSALHSNRQH
ncbi:MAG TPA: hypothetical protein VFI95_01775 [Terriglobales bacterium]|nr:hypothetical protein [Terriglobales bacterium]